MFPFQVGDKVVLADGIMDGPATVPRLVPGRIYCVAETFVKEKGKFFRAHQRVELVGVRLSKRLRTPNAGILYSYFRRVGSPECRAKKGGE